MLAAPDSLVGDVMDTDGYSARVDQDQEEAARLIQEADLLALPVVDTEGRLVGIITVDDAMRILEEEQTEDVARAGGAEPLEHPYLSVSVLGLARSRVVWLMILIVAATLTVNVLNIFESELAAVVTLTLFIPLVIGTGGNAGSQSATTVTRALAVGELRTTDVALVVLREARVGFLLGAMLALIAFLPTVLLRRRQAPRAGRVADAADGVHAGHAGRVAAAAAGAPARLRPGRDERAVHLDARSTPPG